MVTQELISRKPPDPSHGQGTAHVMQTCKSEIFTNLTSNNDNIAGILGLVHPQVLEELGSVSYICVPLIARRRTPGAILYVNRVSKCRYDSFYLTLVEEMANRASMAIDNAQLYLDSQKAINMRDCFLSVVLHDLKNPLFAISAGALLLMDSQLPMERAIVQNIAEQMSKSTSRMDWLIHDLLDLTNLEENQLLIEPHRYDSAALLDEAISQIDIQLKKKQLNLVRNFSQENYFITCDHERSLQDYRKPARQRH